MNKKNLLVVVDYQNDFISSEGKVAQVLGGELLESSQKLAPILQQLIDHWHNTKQPVLFLVSDYEASRYTEVFREARKHNAYNGSAVSGTWGHELYELERGEEDGLIVKHYFDGFYKSQLDEYLKNEQITDIYLCGINTDVCVFHTAIGALVRGYQTYVIEDATETVSPTEQKQIFINYLTKYVGVRTLATKDIIHD